MRVKEISEDSSSVSISSTGAANLKNEARSVAKQTLFAGLISEVNQFMVSYPLCVNSI
jgi:hypothetical protein